MWCVTLLFIAVVSCYAEEFQIKTVELPVTTASRIIGGTPTTIQKYPFTVQVIYNSWFLCGGSLLTTRHVLSAGHCFIDSFGFVANASRYAIRVGTTNLNSGGSLHRVSAIVVHESFNYTILDNDVAVVLLSSTVTLSDSVDLAAIPYQGSVVPDNSTVIAVGWGLTNVNYTFASDVLNEVSVQKINQATCQARYLTLQNRTGFPFPITSSMICAGILDVGGKDACSGDSGGPLIYDNAVVGIISWGNGCAEPEFPGVFARVAYYTDWINNTVTRFQAGDAASLRGNVGAVTLLTTVLYFILSV